MNPAEASPVQQAERILRRYAAFRRLGFDELDAQALASSEATIHAVVSLLKNGCSKQLVVQILA